MIPNGNQRYGRPSGRLYFMRKGDFDGHHHVADHHFAHIDFVWWWLLRSRSLVVADKFGIRKRNRASFLRFLVVRLLSDYQPSVI
jgi:hypothetical protein